MIFINFIEFLLLVLLFGKFSNFVYSFSGCPRSQDSSWVKPRFNWETHDKLTEIEQFKADCKILFEGPV